MRKIKVALLHLLPIVGDIQYNQDLIERAVKQAANQMVDWVITPELAVSGLQFSRKIGADWIQKQPDEWMNHFCSLVKSVNTNVFLGCPERSDDGKLYNSVFVINRNGDLIGRQRKHATISDGWCQPGTAIESFDLEGIKVGIMICADAYTDKVANTLSAQGAEIIVAPSSWGLGLCGPTGEWEQRSIETGVPLFVCNRTGEDETVVFWEAESMILKNGKRLLSHQSKQSAILTFDWNVEKMELITPEIQIENIS